MGGQSSKIIDEEFPPTLSLPKRSTIQQIFFSNIIPPFLTPRSLQYQNPLQRKPSTDPFFNFYFLYILTLVSAPSINPIPQTPLTLFTHFKKKKKKMSSLIVKELIKFLKKKFAADKAAKAGEGEKKAECEQAPSHFPPLSQSINLSIHLKTNTDPFFFFFLLLNSNYSRSTRTSPRMDRPSRCQREQILLR